MKQWSDSGSIRGLADKTLMYRALCSLCWDSIRLPNSGACPEWDGGVRALSYGPSGVASLHSVCLILVSQLQGEAHCLQLWLTELTHFICFGFFVRLSSQQHYFRLLFKGGAFVSHGLWIYVLCLNSIQVFTLLSSRRLRSVKMFLKRQSEHKHYKNNSIYAVVFHFYD